MSETKWERIEFHEIEEGDILKVVTSSNTVNYKTYSEATSRIGVRKVNGEWHASTLKIAGSIGVNFTQQIFRQVPQYEFPKGFGAIIAATHKETGKRFEYVFTGRHWIPKGNPDCLNNEEWFRRHYTDFKTFSEGI